jgi:hypothetical protein
VCVVVGVDSLVLDSRVWVVSFEISVGAGYVWSVPEWPLASVPGVLVLACMHKGRLAPKIGSDYLEMVWLIW